MESTQTTAKHKTKLFWMRFMAGLLRELPSRFPEKRERPIFNSREAYHNSPPVEKIVGLRAAPKLPCTRQSAHCRAVTLLALLGLSLLAEVAFNLNWLRIFAVSMPGIILLVWIVSEM